ncbi:MAG: hypothetical protein LBJ71_03225 [Holosporaceae bacterium]|nr:hypothetical protein [Holosporaceae bacterium]
MKKFILISALFFGEILEARLPINVFYSSENNFQLWGPCDTDMSTVPLQYSLFLGTTFMTAGHLLELRTKGNITPSLDSNGKRNFTKDKGEDDVMSFIVRLFPSCGAGGEVVISSDEQNRYNNSKNKTAILYAFSKMLRFLECYRYLYAINVIYADAYSEKTPEKKKEFLKEVLVSFNSDIIENGKFRIATGEIFKNMSLPLDEKLKKIGEVIKSFFEMKNKEKGKGIGEKSDFFRSLIDSEKRYGYAPYTVESIYLAYIGEFFDDTAEHIVEFNKISKSMRESLFSTQYLAATNPNAQDSELTDISELIKDVTGPNRRSQSKIAKAAETIAELFYSGSSAHAYNNPCRHGSCSRLDLEGNEVTSLPKTFSDCQETTIRHLFNFLMGSKNLSGNKISKTIRNIGQKVTDERNQSPDKSATKITRSSSAPSVRNTLSNRSDRLQEMKTFYTEGKNINGSSREIRKLWNKVVCHLDGVTYKREGNELLSGFTNLAKTIYKVIGKELPPKLQATATKESELPEQNTILSELKSLFELISSKECEVQGRLKIENIENKKQKDYFGRIKVTIKDENKKVLHSFVIDQFSTGHGSVDVVMLENEKNYLAELERLGLSDEEKSVFGYMFSAGISGMSYCYLNLTDRYYKNKNFYHALFPYRWKNQEDSNEQLKRQVIIHGVIRGYLGTSTIPSAKRILLNHLSELRYIFIPEDIIPLMEELNLSSRTDLSWLDISPTRSSEWPYTRCYPDFERTQLKLPSSIEILYLRTLHDVDASECHNTQFFTIRDTKVTLPSSLKKLRIADPKNVPTLNLPASVKTLEIEEVSSDFDLSPYTGLLEVKMEGYGNSCVNITLPPSVKKLCTKTRIKKLTASPEIEIFDDWLKKTVTPSKLIDEIVYLK